MSHTSAASRLALTALAVLMAPRCAAADQVVNLLPNGGAERVDLATDEPADWLTAAVPAKGLRLWRDLEQPASGAASFAIANEHEYGDLVANNWVHELRYVPRGRMIRVRGDVKTDDAEAANICIQCWGADGNQLVAFASTPVLRGSKMWTRVKSQPIVVPKETTTLVVRAALAGQGSAWFDNIRLEIVGPPVPRDPGLAAAVPGRIVRRLPVEKDAMILAYMPEWNHGNVDNIAVASNDGGVRTLLKWKAPSADDVAPSNHRFLLAMYCREARGEVKESTLQVHRLTEAWPELSSWERRPKAEASAAVQIEVRHSQGWKLLDVTPLVRGRADEEDFHGVMLRMASEDCDSERAFKEKKPCPSASFVSREGIGEWENRRPVLLVVDPDQPPVDEPVVSQPAAAESPALTTEEFLQFVEYLASLPESSVRPVPGARQAESAAQQASYKAMEQLPGLNALTPQEHWIAIKSAWIPPYEKFAAAYPLTPEGVTAMSSNLTDSYVGAEQPEAAKRIAAAACQLGRGSEVEYLAEISRAWVQEHVGEIEAAEARLRRVAAATPPEKRDRRTIDILWLAPSNLGDLLYKQKKYEEAEKVYVELIDAVEKWVADHPEDADVAVSYALVAQRGRIDIVLNKNLDDDAAVQQFVDEFERRFPGYAPPTGSAASELRANVEARRRMRDAQREGQ